MHSHVKPAAEKRFESSFEITLEETLKALYQRRLEINKLLRSLEAERCKGLEQKKVSSTQDRSEPARKTRNTRASSTGPESEIYTE